MGSLGMQEIIIIFIIALIVFGPRKLPELGKTIGKGLAEFKKASNELKQTWEDEVKLDKEKEAISEIVKDATIQPSEMLTDNKKTPQSQKKINEQHTGELEETKEPETESGKMSFLEHLDELRKRLVHVVVYVAVWLSCLLGLCQTDI